MLSSEEETLCSIVVCNKVINNSQQYKIYTFTLYDDFMTSHTDIITFKAEDFAHLSPEEGQQVRLVAYREDYRREVMRLREELKIEEFRKLYPDALNIEHIYHIFENDKAPMGIFVPIMFMHEKLGILNPIWMRFTYILVVCNKIDRPAREEFRPQLELSKNLAEKYKKLDGNGEAKNMEDRITFGKFNHATVYDTPRIRVFVHDPRSEIVPRKGEPRITIEISPDTDKKEVTALWPMIQKYQKLFGRKRKQKVPKRISGKRLRTSSKDLDLYAEIAELDRHGLNDEEIWKQLKDRYDYDFSSIRGYVNEAKKLGFVVDNS